MGTELEVPPTPSFEVCGFGHGERRRKACEEVAVVLAIGHTLRTHEALSRHYALFGFLEVVHRLFEDGVFVGHDKSIRAGSVLRSLDCFAFLTRAALQAPRGRGSCPWLRLSGLMAPSMSRRTCAATRTVARKASRDFSRGLRVYHFGSALWASHVLRRLARRCGLGSWEGSYGAFLEPSVVGLSPPSSAPGCDLSTPVGVPSATQGYPCSARALRGYGNAPSYPRTSYATTASVRSSAAVLIAAFVPPRSPSAAPAQDQ